MRLTLRTLLAWLDDTLEPHQVREIGKHVSQSPFAQELADRIHRISRQRRLTVPSSSGLDATDPNLVAGYLDNDLDPESVAEFEKKCLTSDVNLAEVASVHQILSLLGQKVKVPSEARARMYQLVKGREATSQKRAVVQRPAQPEPVTTPIQPWVAPEPLKRSWLKRLGPAAACIFLIFISSGTAWLSLRPPSFQLPAVPQGIADGAAAGAAAMAPAQPVPVGPDGEKPEAAASEVSPVPPPPMVAAAGDAAQPQQDRSAEAAGLRTPSSSPDSEPAGVSKLAKSSDSAAKAKAAAPLPTVPEGSSGLAEKADGVFLRYSPNQREWLRLADPTPVNRSDQLLCLTPARATILMGKMRIVLVGETEVRILSQASDPVPALELVQGRLLIRQPASSALNLVFSGRPVGLEISPESSLALERVETRSYGPPITRTPPLAIECIQGQVSFSVDQKPETLNASSVAVIDSAGQVKRSTPDSLPPWATESEPSPYELQVKDQFLGLFHPGRPVLAEIVAAIEDERPEIKRLAVSALKALGDLSLLMPMLSRQGDPVARRSTLAAIRAYMGRGPDSVTLVRKQLDEEFGENVGELAMQMLIGYAPDALSNRDLYPRLVSLLSPEQESVGIRELALDNLKRLTGRDDLGYDPDHPQGKGLDAWNDLLRRNELRLLAPRTKVK